MQTQPKYQSKGKTVVMGERTMTIKNLTLILSPPKEREQRKREVEQKSCLTCSASTPDSACNPSTSL